MCSRHDHAVVPYLGLLSDVLTLITNWPAVTTTLPSWLAGGMDLRVGELAEAMIARAG